MDYQVGDFEERLQRAVGRAKVVLDATKAPCFPSGVHHQYQDKYLLAECLTNVAVASQVNCLVALGLQQDSLRQACAWAEASAVSLRFRSRETCKFNRKETREVDSASKSVSELSVGGVVKAALTSKTTTKVTEHIWDFEASYSLELVRGVGEQPSDRLPVLSRTGRVERRTTSENPPAPEVREPAASFDVNISWLVRQLDAGTLMPGFKVDRADNKCYTPRRNPGIDAASELFEALGAWARSVRAYFRQLLSVQPDASLSFDFSALSAEAVFIPVLPLFVDTGASAIAEAAAEADSGSRAASAAAAAEPQHPVQEGVLACLPAAGGPPESALLAVADSNRLLGEEVRSLREKHEQVNQVFPTSAAVATAAEAVTSVTLEHCGRVCQCWNDAVKYIEDMLRAQLIAAIGKEVQPADFAEYMQFHNRRLFGKAYLPIPFCFSVRRSEQHSPEGTVSIEEKVVGSGGDSNVATPIVTVVQRAEEPQPMRFALGASASVSFRGERYLHAWLSHQFSGQSGASLSLVARARQFSSMLVLVGRITSIDTFDPKYAAIVQNKDELTIPLQLSTIPTPGEFRDAIESLSPEQQAFCKAFRSMQLESTLFGVLVIQIKPQLERVLNLPKDSLTKEIKMTQELMQLFVKYQIPSDLLSFDPDGPPAEEPQATESEDSDIEIVGGAAPAAAPRPPKKPVDVVKGHMRSIQAVISQTKGEEIEERRMQERFRGLDSAGGGDIRSQPIAQRFFVPESSKVQAPPADQQGQQRPKEQQHQQQQQQSHDGLASGGPRDYTQVPTELDRRFGALDMGGGALRPSIITPGEVWTKQAQKALLAKPTTSRLGADAQKKEKDAAFDLLDALTKSGAMAIEDASLHIVVAATHCFDKSVTETLVKDNCNPIDNVERSTLVMASTVHQQLPAALIQDAELQRVTAASPALFLQDADS